MINKFYIKSDSLGVAASGLCLIHCIATPFLFAIQPLIVYADGAPIWWKSLDYFFLLISFFAVYQSAKNTSKRVNIKEKLNSSEKNQFNTLINDSKNLKLLNIMSNICYKKVNRDQKGLGVFMDILFRSCEQ